MYYPRSDAPPAIVVDVVKVFETIGDDIDSTHHHFKSDEVLEKVRDGLQNLDFAVETGKKAVEKIHVPVLFGLGGRPEKSFEADAYHKEAGCVIEVEAGRTVVNNQFLKDLFQACMMHGVKHLIIAVRNQYRNSQDFQRVIRWFDTLYASNRMNLPLEGIAIIGY